MKLLHIIGLTAYMALTATSAPAAQAPPASSELFVATLDTTTTPSTRPYNLEKLDVYIEQRWDLVEQLAHANDIIMKRVFHDKAEAPSKYERRIRNNLIRMAANTQKFSAQLDRNVAAMAALAKPAGSPYKGISVDEIRYVWGMGLSFAGYCEIIQNAVTDKSGKNNYIRPFLWAFASEEIQQGQAVVRNMQKNFERLAEFVKASKRNDPSGMDYYDKAFDQISAMYAKGGEVYSYVNWPAPPPQSAA